MTKPVASPAKPEDACSIHDITGTGRALWVSRTKGVASISFNPSMSAGGVGVGATEQKLKAEYTNLVPAGPNYSYRADADGNPSAQFLFGVLEGKLTGALLLLRDQDCHN